MSQDAALVEIRELESDYEILGELGRGGMAVVYLARDRQLGRQVAIKVIHAAAGADEQMVARQLAEARTVAQLQHPNVVAMYAVRRLSTLGLALVMQYVPGRTLERALREDGPFAPERAEAVLSDIAAALAYAHARGVIHRDIKPDNVFLNDDTGRALLSDFGIALSPEEGRQQVTTDMIVGTPAYMSPEQIDGGQLDGRSDVFGLGLIGYEMLAGPRAWLDEGISDVMYRQKFEQLPPLAEVRPDTPIRLRVAIERALVKERDQRWPTAATFLDALTDDEWVPDAPAPGTPFGTATPGPQRLVTPTPVRSLTPAAATTPLNTMQYRREPDSTPRRSIPSFQPPRPRGRRLAALIIPAVFIAAAAAAMVTHPELIARATGLGHREADDSLRRAQEIGVPEHAGFREPHECRGGARGRRQCGGCRHVECGFVRGASRRHGPGLAVRKMRDSLAKAAGRKPPVVASGSRVEDSAASARQCGRATGAAGADPCASTARRRGRGHSYVRPGRRGRALVLGGRR